MVVTAFSGFFQGFKPFSFRQVLPIFTINMVRVIILVVAASIGDITGAIRADAVGTLPAAASHGERVLFFIIHTIITIRKFTLNPQF